MSKCKFSLSNLRMILLQLALLSCHLAEDASGALVPGTVLLGSSMGSAESVSDEPHVMKDEKEGDMAFDSGVRFSQLMSHLFRVFLSAPFLKSTSTRITLRRTTK
jgi:hypothetical protein